MSSLRIARLVLGSAALLLVVACGGGGGGGATTPASSSAGVLLGKRALPGYAVSIRRIVIADGRLDLRIVIEPDPGQPAVVAVAAWTATEHVPDGGTPAVLGGDGSWSVSVSRPDAPSTAAWVRLTAADGSMLEAGFDFPLQ